MLRMAVTTETTRRPGEALLAAALVLQALQDARSSDHRLMREEERRCDSPGGDTHTGRQRRPAAPSGPFMSRPAGGLRPVILMHLTPPCPRARPSSASLGRWRQRGWRQAHPRAGMSAMGAHGTAGTRGSGVGHGSCVARHELGSLWPLVLPDAGLGTERQDHPERGAWVPATGFGMAGAPLVVG